MSHLVVIYWLLFLLLVWNYLPLYIFFIFFLVWFQIVVIVDRCLLSVIHLGFSPEFSLLLVFSLILCSSCLCSAFSLIIQSEHKKLVPQILLIIKKSQFSSPAYLYLPVGVVCIIIGWMCLCDHFWKKFKENIRSPKLLNIS